MFSDDGRQFWGKNVIPSFDMFDASNLTVSESVYEEVSIQRTRRIAYRIIAPIFISFGLLGNSLTVAILGNKRFKGVTYNYFFGLAITDLVSLLLSTSAVIHLLHPTTKAFWKAYWYAHFESFLVNSAMGASVLIVVCITVDRYFSVCRPQQFKLIHTNRNCIVGICFSILLSATVWLPTCFLKKAVALRDCEPYHDVIINTNETLWVACQIVNTQDDTWYNIYAWCREAFTIFIPILLVIILNSLLLYSFRKNYKVQQHRILANTNSPSNNIKNLKHETEARHLMSLLKGLMVSFMVTLLPAGVFNAAYIFDANVGLKYEIFQAFANDLQLLNHASNFYLYILLSKPVRDVIVSYVGYSIKFLTDNWLVKKRTLMMGSSKDKTISQDSGIDNVANSSIHIETLK